MAGALRRRGLWLVFGALGGLIGGTLVAASTKPHVSYKTYYKATSIMRLEIPAATTHPVDSLRWSLQLAQMSIAGDAYRLAVATESGLTTKQIKNHLISIAYEDSGVLELTAVTTQAETATQVAYHAADQLNRAVAADVDSRLASQSSGLNDTIKSIDTLINQLREDLAKATDDERPRILRDLSAAQSQVRQLRDEREGMTISPPKFVLATPPSPIRINSRAYFQRWSLANNDLGIPRIKANTNLATVSSQDVLGRQAVTRSLLEDTELPEPEKPSPVTPISLGLLAGLVMGLSGVVLGEAWDDRIHDSVHAMRTTGLEVIVEIPRLSRRRVLRLLDMHSTVHDPRVEDAQIRYREAAWVIAGQLGIDPRRAVDARDGGDATGDGHRAPIIMVTSSSPSEGKTTSTAALASALGYLGFRVLAVDGDYHHRSLRKLLRPIPSFVDPEAPAETRVDRVWHMDDPASADRKTTSSTIVARLIHRADAQRDNFDIILLDTPPVTATTDAVEFLQYADAAVLIVRLDQTPADACEQTVTTILRQDMITPGIIVTDVTPAVIDRYVDVDG